MGKTTRFIANCFLLNFLFLVFLVHSTSVKAQSPFQKDQLNALSIGRPNFKVYTRSYGSILGFQRGKFTYFELGAEKHWTKVKLIKQKTYSLGANLEYNFKYNTIGYKVSGWMKVGRINLTYGVNLCYFTNFNESRFGGGPAVGFRLLGFHFINGYNFTTGSEELNTFNKLYVTIRYFFPLEKKIKFRKKNKS